MGIRILLIAFGSRGDVQPPLAVVARLWQQNKHDRTVALLTHQEHQAWLGPYLQACDCRLFLSPSPVLRPAPNTEVDAGGCTGSDGDDDESLHRRRCVSAAEEFFGLGTQNGGDSSEADWRQGQQQQQQQGCIEEEGERRQKRQQRLLLFNLFALEAFHIAQAMGLPCAALSPCVVPYCPPPAFERALSRKHPRLVQALKAAEPGRQVSWHEVEHWMWPLFSERRWGDWRICHLGLVEEPIPYLGQEGERRMRVLPPAPPLIYGISPHVLQVPGYWPSTQHCSGFFFWPKECALPLPLPLPPPPKPFPPAPRPSSTSPHAQVPSPTPAAAEGGLAPWLALALSLLQRQVSLPSSPPQHAAGCSAAAAPTAAAAVVVGGGQAAAAVASGCSSSSAAAAGGGAEAAAATTAAAAGVNGGGDVDGSGGGGSGTCLPPNRLRPLAVVDFGYMGALGLLVDPGWVVALLQASLQRAGMRAVLLTGGWQPLHDAALQAGVPTINLQLGLPGSGGGGSPATLQGASISISSSARATTAGHPLGRLRPPPCPCTSSPDPLAPLSACVPATATLQRAAAAGDLVCLHGSVPHEQLLAPMAAAAAAVSAAPAASAPLFERVAAAAAAAAAPRPLISMLPVAAASPAAVSAAGPAVAPRAAVEAVPGAAEAMPGAAPGPSRAATAAMTSAAMPAGAATVAGAAGASSPCAPAPLLLLHHGGAGTAAAALRAGVPQVVCPLQFDQFQLAERLSWLGAAVAVNARDLRLGTAAAREAREATALGSPAASGTQSTAPGIDQAAEVLARALVASQADDVTTSTAELARAMAADEDGTTVAARILLDFLHSWQPEQQRQWPPPPPPSPPSLPPPPGPAAGSRGGRGGDTVLMEGDACEDGEVTFETWGPASVAGCPVEHVWLPNGMCVATTSPAEALFIYQELWPQAGRLPPPEGFGYLWGGVALGPGATVVDVGANIGLFALQLLTSESPPAEVWVLEPLPPNMQLLEANCAAAGIADKVRALPLGLSSTPGRLTFSWWPDAPGNSTCRPEEKERLQGDVMRSLPRAARRYECEVDTLSAVIARHRIGRVDLLKVDVEGAELDVLHGIQRRHWPCIRQVAIEVHAVDGRLTAVVELLKREGFTVRAHRPTHVTPNNYLVVAIRG